MNVKNIIAKDALIGKNAKTTVRDSSGKVVDLKDSKQVKIDKIIKLNNLIVKL